MTSGSGSNTSLAFWELKAEQVMDRVFSDTGSSRGRSGSAPSDDDSIDVEVREAPARAARSGGLALVDVPLPEEPAEHGRGWSASQQARRAGRWLRSRLDGLGSAPHRPPLTATWLKRPWQVAGVSISPRTAIACSGALACLAMGTSFTLWLGWNQASNDLRQERTIRLLEGLRDLGPAADSAPTTSVAAATPDKPADKPEDGLPPPPPDEPWIEELSQLDGQSGGGAAPLQVPVNGTLRAPAPVASATAAAGASRGPATALTPAAAPTPELVGVVQVPGRQGSAIFQVGGSSTSAGMGESIGSSGWRLLSTNGDSALIERGGVTRRVSISSGL